jgi:hypothetical protein
MLTLLSPTLRSSSTLFSRPAALQTASFVLARRNRENAAATELTHDDTDVRDRAQTTDNTGIDQITNILDNAVLSPQSNNFSSKLLLTPLVNFPRLNALLPPSWRKV